MTSDRARSELDESVIRAALLAAVDVAREDLRDVHRHREVPGPIARVAGFRNLSKAALSQVRGALDDDVAFRQRVLGVAGDANLDGPSRLFLARPENWEEDLGRVVREAEAHADAQAEERAAERRLRAAEAARLRAEEARQEAEDAAAAATAQLEVERSRAADVGRRLAAAEVELAQAKQALDDLVGKLRQAEGKQAEEAHRVEQVAAARDHLRAERDELRALLEEAATPPAGGGPPSDSGEVTAASVAPALGAVADAVAEAGRAAAAMAESLSMAAQQLRGPLRNATDPAASPAPRARPSRSAPRSPASGRRIPVPVPPGVFDDSPQAAHHLVSVPGIVLFVDGYNASLRRWPQLPIEDQRDRLVTALAELSARCGPSVHVVFDGVVAASRAVAGGARGVAVSFTEEGVEADDAILDAVEAHSGPVLVASDDRRVRSGAERLGANVLSMEQLFAVLRREG